MFSSNFAEGSYQSGDHATTPRSVPHNIRQGPPHLNLILDEFEDSDNDDEEEEAQPSNSPRQADDSVFFLPDSNQDDFDKVDVQSTGTNDQFSSPQTEPSNLPDEASKTADSKMTIVVRDAAYTTYRAMLYYVRFLKSL